MNRVLQETESNEIDFVKIDREGREHTALGCASLDTLRKIRFIGGEYHGIGRFFAIMQGKLFLTHHVNLIGGGGLGSFFAEREGEARTILKQDRIGMLRVRPGLGSGPLSGTFFAMSSCCRSTAQPAHCRC